MANEHRVEHESVFWVRELGANRAFEVGTARGYATKYGADPDAFVAETVRKERPLAHVIELPFVDYDAALVLQKRDGLEVSFGDVFVTEDGKYLVRPRPGDEVELVPQK